MKITRRFGRCTKTYCDQWADGGCQFPCLEREIAILEQENDNLKKEKEKDND